MKKSIFAVVALALVASLFVPMMVRGQQRSGPVLEAVRLGFVTSTLGNWLIPSPYLSSTHLSTVTTATPKTSVGVLGCVIIGVAGAAASTVTIYNGDSAVAGNILTIVDGATVGQKCYGIIFNHGGGFHIVVASGGAVPDVTVTWR